MYESREGSFSYEFAYEFAYAIPPIGPPIGYEVDMKCKLGIIYNWIYIFNFIFPSCPIGDLIGYEIIYFNRKLHMLLDMEMNLPGFRTWVMFPHSLTSNKPTQSYSDVILPGNVTKITANVIEMYSPCTGYIHLLSYCLVFSAL